MKRSSLALVFLLTVLPGQALAVTMEYHVYNAFGPVTNAIKTMALIFSDSRYHLLFLPLAVASGLGIMALQAIRGIKAGKVDFGFAPLLPLFAGITVYIGTIVPTGSLMVQDKVLNKSMEISGIPELAVVFLGVTNSIERSIIEIVDTSVLDQAMSYRSGAGGIGFDLIKKIAEIKPGMSDGLREQSLEGYMSNCLLFELQRPGTTLTINNIAKNNDFIGILDQAADPIVPTVVYDAANPTGLAMSCAEAWTGVGGIKNYYASPGTFEEYRKSICKQAGIDPDDISSYASCKSIIDGHIKLAASQGNPMPSIDYIRQAHLAASLNNALNSSSTDKAAMALANQNMMMQGMTTFMVANEYMPVIRGIVIAFSIILLPIFALFLVTPVYGKVLNQMMGLFVFVMFWGIMDAVTHVLTINMAIDYFAEVAMNQTGYDGMMLTPSAAGKALGLFGTMRMLGVTLAATFASIAGFSSGALMAGAVGQMTGSITAGASQGAQAASIEGKGKKLTELEQSFGSVSVANASPDFLRRGRANAAQKQTGIAYGAAQAENMAGHEEAAAMDAQQKLATHDAQNRVAHEMGFSDRAAANADMSAGQIGTTLGSQEGEVAAWSKVGLSSQAQIAKFKASGSVVTAKMAQAAKKNGLQGIKSGMKLDSLAVGEKGQVMAKGSMALTAATLAGAKELMRTNKGETAAADLHEGQMMDFNINANSGEGVLDATQASRSKTGDTQSDVRSSKFMRTSEVDTSRTQKAGSHIDAESLAYMARTGDKALTDNLYDAHGNLDQAAMKGQAMVAANAIQQVVSKQMSESGGAKGEAGLSTTNTLLGKAGINVGASTYSNKSVTEQKNMIYGALLKKQEAIFEAYKNGNLPNRDAFDHAYANMMKKALNNADNEALDANDEYGITKGDQKISKIF